MKYSEVKKCLQGTDKDTLKGLIEDYGEELVRKFVEDSGYDLDDFEEMYQGEHDSNEDFVQTLLEDTGDLPKDLPCYIHIDWESTARDIMMDYMEIGGHYFRSI